jgi:hypothetical protein
LAFSEGGNLVRLGVRTEAQTVLGGVFGRAPQVALHSLQIYNEGRGFPGRPPASGGVLDAAEHIQIAGMQAAQAAPRVAGQ